MLWKQPVKKKGLSATKTSKIPTVLNFNAVEIKWQLVSLLTSWLMHSKQPFIMAVVFVMELRHLIFLDTERSCERPQLSPPCFGLLKVSRQGEITFKGFRTYYRAVRGAAGGHWWLFGSVMLLKPEAFKDKNRFRRSDVNWLTQPTSDCYAYLPSAAPWTDGWCGRRDFTCSNRPAQTD